MTSDWSTPQDFFDKVNSVMHFNLDVCVDDQNHKCNRYFTARFDGLLMTWDGICWCNPPYDRTLGKWVKKAYEEGKEGGTVVCLLPARPGSNWFCNYALKGHIIFLRDRLKFGGQGRAPFPSMLVIFGGTPEQKEQLDAMFNHD